MSSEHPVLRLDKVSKIYHLYEQPHHRLLQMFYGPRRIFFREFWALRDVSFKVMPGECVGIIGRNGAGKSTLLQIIAGTLNPTHGECQTHGRIAALLELGSGFNMEFTGRENVHLNAAVLGMSAEQLEEKLDAILAFADIGDFIDQPVKTYSSGMKMRLAFAVQAHIEPDILIVDEALSVGDGAFQTKCMQYMRQLLERNTTILFVSHSMNVVRMFCDRTIWMENGKIIQDGETKEVTSRYSEVLMAPTRETKKAAPQITEKKDKTAAQESLSENPSTLIPLDQVQRTESLRRWGGGEIQVAAFTLSGEQSGFSKVYEFGEKVTLQFSLDVHALPPGDMPSAAFAIRNRQGLDILSISTDRLGVALDELEPGKTSRVQFKFTMRIVPGEYSLILAIAYNEAGKRVYSDYVENAHYFTIVSSRYHNGLYEPETEVKLLNG